MYNVGNVPILLLSSESRKIEDPDRFAHRDRKHMRFDVLTIFPKIFDSYFGESILKRAREKKLLEIRAHNIRDFSRDKHHKARPPRKSWRFGRVDDKPFGGGAGMVMMAEPILHAVDALHLESKISDLKSGEHKKSRQRRGSPRVAKIKIAVLSAKGKFFDQKMAHDWAKKYDRIVLISGRYEGIDERVTKILHAEEISIGPYVLTDGDVAAMAIVSAVTRLIPGVITPQSLEEESHWNLLAKKGSSREASGLLPPHLSATKRWGGEYPQYTRPEVLEWKKKTYRVPKVLLSGNHKEIERWRQKQGV